MTKPLSAEQKAANKAKREAAKTKASKALKKPAAKKSAAPKPTHNVQGYMVQGDNLIVVIDNKQHTVNAKTHIGCYTKIVEALNAGRFEEVENLVDSEKAVIAYGNGDITLVNDVINYKGRPMHNALSRRLLNMIRENANFDSLVLFMDNLMSNPSCRAIEELYGFLEKNKLPITIDGHFLAYKRVRADYTDCHSGKFDNRVGAVCEMVRNEVDDNCNRTCSNGLHFASLEYVKDFGGRQDPVVILKINPRDVVSIPVDYNNQKGRCCKYEVVGQHNVRAANLGEEAFVSTVVGADGK